MAKQHKPKLYKRILSHPILICSFLIILILGGASFYYFSNGGSTGLDHKEANQAYQQKKQNQQKQFAQIHTDSFPTIEDVKSKLHSQLGNDLAKVNYSTLQNTLIKDYGKKAASQILSGNLLSKNMSPKQAEQAEVNIARKTGSFKGYVGYSTLNTDTNLYDGTIKANDNVLHYGPLYSYSDNVQWNSSPDGNYKISQPFINATQSNNIVGAKQIKNPQQYTMIEFVQPNANTNYQTLTKDIGNIGFQVDGEKVKLSGNNSVTAASNQGIYGKGYGLQLARNSGSNFNKSNKIMANSVIPICFDVAKADDSHDYEVKVPQVNSYLLKHEMNSNINLN